MNVEVRAAPDIDLVVHIVKMRSGGDGIERGCERCGPLAAIHAARRRAGLAWVVEQGNVGVAGIGSQMGAAIRFKTVSGVTVVRVHATLRAVFGDREAPVSVSRR